MISRRTFLAGTGIATGAAVLGRFARGEPVRAPRRIVLIHKPVGTAPDLYDCAGTGRDFTLSPILEPFADLREHMTVVDGLAVLKQANTPGEDHANGMTTFLTGGIPYRPPGSSTLLTTRASIDQVLAADPRFVAPVPSMQLTADDRGHQFLVRVLSHAGHGLPIPPEESPLAAFTRVFGTVADRELTPDQAKELRARKQSVLDFTRADLARMQQRMGNAERERIDRHLTSIREVEQVIHRVADVDPLPIYRQMTAAHAGLTDRDRNHGQIGRAHLELVRAAFQCDLTRIASFTWGSWSTNVSGFLPKLDGRTYHEVSHAGPAEDEAAVHRYYNEQLAVFLRGLRDTPDVDGRSLLDNTLVVNWTEMRLGTHSFDNTPIQLFGGAVGWNLPGGRIVRFPGFSTNDLWRTVRNSLGDEAQTFGDAEKNSGRLVGLFDESRFDEFAADSSDKSR